MKLGFEVLRKSGVSEPMRDASLLLCDALGKDRAFLIAHPEYELLPSEYELFLSYVERRAKREPIQYIRGYQEFYGLEFKVSKDVLIPRPETELVVECSIGLLKAIKNARFCEIGIGSGCISVSILHEVRDSSGVGIDISKRALEVARINAVRHGVMQRLELRQSDLFEKVNSHERFDLVVSNPPYVSESEFELLQKEVRRYEPRIALVAGNNGLSVIRKLISDSIRFLKPDGYLVLEIGFGQAEFVLNLLGEKWKDIRFLNDLQGIQRVLVAKRSS